MDSPRTSIIMPVYKTAHRVISSIESVLAQTDQDFELLVINDGSPDDSAQVINRFLEENPDPRVRFFNRTENRGVSATRNQGLDEARGEWIAFLDSDDKYRPQFLEKLHGYAQRHSAQIVTSVLSIVKPDGSVTDRPVSTLEEMSGDDAALRLLKGQGVTPYVADKLVRADLFEGVRFPSDIHRGEDALTTLALCLKAEKLVSAPEVQYEYLMDTGGLTWGQVTSVDESLRLMEAQKQLLGEKMQTPEGRRAFDTSWIITFLNSSQQALFNNTAEGKQTLQRNRELITWKQIFNIRSVNLMFFGAATLLKVSPTLYRRVYGLYIKRTYGL